MGTAIKIPGITVGTTEAASTAIPKQRIDGGSWVLTSTGPTTITWYERVAEGGSFVIARREGSDVTQTVAASRSQEIPYSLNAAHELKAVASAGTAGVMAIAGLEVAR